MLKTKIWNVENWKYNSFIKESSSITFLFGIFLNTFLLNNEVLKNDRWMQDCVDRNWNYKNIRFLGYSIFKKEMSRRTEYSCSC